MSGFALRSWFKIMFDVARIKVSSAFFCCTNIQMFPDFFLELLVRHV